MKENVTEFKITEFENWKIKFCWRFDLKEFYIIPGIFCYMFREKIKCILTFTLSVQKSTSKEM